MDRIFRLMDGFDPEQRFGLFDEAGAGAGGGGDAAAAAAKAIADKAAADKAAADAAAKATADAAAAAARAPAGSGFTDEEFAKLSPATQNYIKSLRSESQQHRESKTRAEAERDQLKAKADEAERKSLADQGKFKELYEKSQADLETERTARRTQTLETALREAATAAGILDVDLVTTSLVSRTGITITDAGQVVGAREAIEGLKAQRPHLFKAPDNGGGSDRGTGPRNPPPADGGGGGPKSVAGLSREEYAAARRKGLSDLKVAR